MFVSFYADLPATVWIVGDSHIHWAGEQALQRVDGPQLGLEHRYDIIWRGKRGARLESAPYQLYDFLCSTQHGPPQLIIFHLGCNDFVDTKSYGIHKAIQNLFEYCQQAVPGATLIWSYILPRRSYKGAFDQSGMGKKLRDVNRNACNLFWRAGGKAIQHSDINSANKYLFRPDGLHLSTLGLDIFLNSLKGALEYFHKYPYAYGYPQELQWAGRDGHTCGCHT